MAATLKIRASEWSHGQRWPLYHDSSSVSGDGSARFVRK
jgi:hypothetical protein